MKVLMIKVDEALRVSLGLGNFEKRYMSYFVKLYTIFLEKEGFSAIYLEYILWKIWGYIGG